MDRYRLMVVDDDPDVRYVVTSLVGLEFETTQACNGLDALEKIDRHEPDMLLVDIYMPVMNGIACCARIKRNPTRANLPVVFVSGSSDPLVRAQAMEAGGIAFFEKPFNTSDLIETLRKHFEEQKNPPSAKKLTVDEIEEVDAIPLDAVETEQLIPELSRPEYNPADTQQTRSDVDDASGRKKKVFGKSRAVPREEQAEAVPEVAAPKTQPAPEPIIEADSRNIGDKISADGMLPTPPPVDYSRISRDFNRKFQEVANRLESKEKRADESRGPSIPSTDDVRQPGYKKPPGQPAPPSAIPPSSSDKVPTEERQTVKIKKPDAGTFDPRSVERIPSTTNIPLPPMEPVRPAAEYRPIAPPPTRPPVSQPSGQPSPAELLAQRRRALMQKAGLAPAGGSIQPGTQKPRVLVIIDDPNQLIVCNSALKGLAEFLPLEDPDDAVELTARFTPDIVVLGIREKNYSGLDFANMIRVNPRLAHIDLLFIQSYGNDEGQLRAATQLSRNAILRRPLTVQNFQAAIRAILQKPGFMVREKTVGYGTYVNEVMKAADVERGRMNREREKQAFKDQHQSLLSFMATELRDIREPKGMEELKGIGSKSYQIRD